MSFAEAAAAAQGGAISTTLLYPLEVLKTRLQSSSKTPRPGSTRGEEEATGRSSPTDAESQNTSKTASAPEEDVDNSIVQIAREIYRRSGWVGFFDGVEYAALQAAIEKYVYFYAYSVMKNVSQLRTGGFSPRENLIVGYLSEAVHLPITVPLEVVITRIITSKGRLRNLQQAFREAVKDDGVRGLYKGVGAYTMLCLKPAIQYTVYEQLRAGILRVLSNRRGAPVTSLTALQAFLLGAVSRAVATLLIFPVIRAKKVLMATTQPPDARATGQSAPSAEQGDQPPPAPKTILDVIRQTLEYEGPGALYRGVAPELTRGVLSAALMLSLKEQLYGVNRRLLDRRK